MATNALPKVMIGCDPELFLFKPDGSPKSAHDIIPGDKKKPHKVELGAIQVDGVAAEFNINPAPDVGTFITNITTVMTNLEGRIGPLKIGIQPTAVFSEKDWEEIPPSQKVLGCDPDYNAYTMEVNPPPDPHGKPMRTAAGHVHVGFTGKKVRVGDPDHFVDCCTLVRNLDYILGLPSLLWDGDNERRTLYGRAGAFRPKPYGVEYRTLSNMWLSSKELMQFVYNATVFTTYALLRGEMPDMSEKYGDFAMTAINTGDTEWFKKPRGVEIKKFLTDNIVLPTIVLEKLKGAAATKNNTITGKTAQTVADIMFDPRAWAAAPLHPDFGIPRG